MNRHVVAGLLGLALAGCAQSRPVLGPSSTHTPAVEITPSMASIHESINRENPRVDPRSLRADLRAMAARQGPEDGLAIVPRVANPVLASGRVPSAPASVPGSANPGSLAATPVGQVPAAVVSAPPAAAPPEVSGVAVSPVATMSTAGDPGRAWAEAQRAVSDPETTLPAPLEAGPERVTAPAPAPEQAVATGDPLMDYDPFAEPSPVVENEGVPEPKPTEGPVLADSPPPPQGVPADQAVEPSSLPQSPDKGDEVPVPVAEAPAEPTNQDPDVPADESPDAAQPPVPVYPSPQGPAPAAPEPAQNSPAPAPQENAPPVDGTDAAEAMPPVPTVPMPEPEAPPVPSVPTVPMPEPEAPPVPSDSSTLFLNPPAPIPLEARPPTPGVTNLPAGPPEEARPAPEPAPSPADGLLTEGAGSGPVVPTPEGPAPSAPAGVVVENGDRLLGPNPDIWPRIVLPPAGSGTPRIAVAPSDRAPAPTPVPTPGAPATAEEPPSPPPAPEAIEQPAVVDLPAPVDPAPEPAPSPEPGAFGTVPEPIALPAEPVQLPPAPDELLPEPPTPADPTAGGVTPRPVDSPSVDLLELPPPDGPVAKRAAVVDPAVQKAGHAAPPVPVPVRAPSGAAEPKPLPVSPADLPVELPSLSGPEASLRKPGAGRAGDAGAPAQELPLGRDEMASLTPVPKGPRAGQVVAARVRKVSYSPASASGDDPTAVKIPAQPSPPRSVFEAGRPAARVGEEVITLLELKRAIALRMKSAPAGQIDAETRYMLAKTVLADLVDRSIVIQEARRTLKNPKQIEIFMTQADKIWAEEELPPLLRETASANIHELKRKLEERGESVDDHREAFRKEFLFRGFIEHKLGPRLKVELPEMRHYYLDHLAEFDRPAQITWREIVVDVTPATDHAAARRKADAILDQLLRGADFAKLAEGESSGPNRSSGGLWQTAPGSYAVKEVNEALDVLPIGRVSRVIDGPTGYHIVRVEARRPAGPAPFGDAQEQIHKNLRNEKIRRESTAYLESLRKMTVVTTVFDDPAVQRASVEVNRPPTR